MNLIRHVQFISRFHNDKDVHIAVFVRRTIGVRAERDDPVGTELVGKLTANSRITRMGTLAPWYQRLWRALLGVWCLCFTNSFYRAW